MDNQAAVCVCGCTQEQHEYLHEHSHYPESRSVDTWQACELHNCGRYRPVLEWPDSAGNWWVSCHVEDDEGLYGGNKILAKVMSPCLASGMLNKIILIWDGKIFMRDDWHDLYGPARFTKLLEQNPFAKLTANLEEDESNGTN